MPIDDVYKLENNSKYNTITFYFKDIPTLSDNIYIKYNYNYETVYKVIEKNINISEITNDSTISIGYIERFPYNINTHNILYKNSFSGYISEFTYLKNQSYFRKFDNLIDQNYFDVITKLYN
jgi:hypothetical protein